MPEARIAPALEAWNLREGSSEIEMLFNCYGNCAEEAEGLRTMRAQCVFLRDQREAGCLRAGNVAHKLCTRDDVWTVT